MGGLELERSGRRRRGRRRDDGYFVAAEVGPGLCDFACEVVVRGGKARRAAGSITILRPVRFRVDTFYFGSASFTNLTRSAWYFAADGWSMYTMWPAS